MTTSRGRVAGFVEGRVLGVVRGWALDLSSPETRVRLLMYVDGEAVGEVDCVVQRNDLLRAGVPRGDCGFEWTIPAGLLDGGRHVLAVRGPGGAALPFKRGFLVEAPWVAGPRSWMPAALFDAGYYLAHNHDVAEADISALAHFVRDGDKERRAPHPLFDVEFYRAGVAVPAGVGAVEYYVRSGGVGNPHPLFDGRFYLGEHADARAAGRPALEHYLSVGAGLGYDPHPAFDAAYYAGVCPAGRGRALLHYVTAGREAGLSPHPLFDPVYQAGQAGRLGWDGGALPVRGPVISVIVPVHDTPPGVLRACIESVVGQSYTSWELCLVDDGSRRAGTLAVLASYRGRDPRIRVDRSAANLHIARATNRGALQATGTFLAFLDHDDLLAPEALAEVAAAVGADGSIDMLYTDEDKIDGEGRRCDPYRKPDWSPEHLRSVMYVLHLLVVRKSVFWAVGGSRPERTGAQDYDLALRVARVARRVHHIPRVLYHWRMLAGSAAGEVGAKPYALEAGRAALQDDVDRDGMGEVVEAGLLPGTFRVRWGRVRGVGRPAVTLLILTHDGEREIAGRGRINLVCNFVRSIVERSTYRDYRIVVMDDSNSSAATKRYLKGAGAALVRYRLEGAFNYSHKANFAVRAADTEQVVILNDDLEVISPDWIEALMEQSVREAVGGVGGRLLYPDGRIQHSGIVLGVEVVAGHAFLGLGREVVGYNGYTHVVRNYSAVTGAVFATRRSVLEAVGGFDERLSIDYNDVDLCLRIGQTGRRIVFTPHCELYHFEGSTAVRTTQRPDEQALFVSRWSGAIARDPYYNPGLPRDRLSFG